MSNRRRPGRPPNDPDAAFVADVRRILAPTANPESVDLSHLAQGMREGLDELVTSMVTDSRGVISPEQGRAVVAAAVRHLLPHVGGA